MPRSLLFALGTGTKWFSGLARLPEDKVAFYDIETEPQGSKGERFLFGKVISLRGSKIQHFDSAEIMSKFLMRYNAVIGFNNYRFDNEILAKEAPAYFESIDLPRFTLRSPKQTLCLDALLFYMLWKPWSHDHKMQSLAKEFGMAIPGLDDKEARCSAELRTLAAFFPHMAAIHDWHVGNFNIDPFTMFSLPIYGLAKLRRWCYQSYILQCGGYPELVKVGCHEKANFYRCFKKGFYRDVRRWDCRSAYPTVAAGMKLGIYGESDFSEFMRWLIGQRDSNPGISTTIKWFSNSLIGDMGNTRGDLYNASIMSSIWLAHKHWMESKVRRVRKANVLFSYADNFYSQKALDFGDTAPHELKREVDFVWLAVYNQQRLLGLQQDGTFFRRHFDRDMRQLGMWSAIDDTVEQFLKVEPEKFLRNPLCVGWGAGIRGMHPDALKLVVYKGGEECRDMNYWLIWDQLNVGFNEVWLGKRGKLLTSFNKNKVDFARYEKMARKYLQLYKMEVKV